MSEPLGPQTHSILIKKVIRFKLFAIFALDIVWGQETPKRSKLLSQDLQKLPQRSLGALRSTSGESPEPPKNTPGESTFGDSLLSSRFFSTLFLPLVPFWYHFELILEPLLPQQHSIFIKVIKFKLFAIFASDIVWGLEHHPKTLQNTHPGPPKGIPEEPRSAQESPRRAPRASRKHPQRALRVPLGGQKVSWGGFGSLRASFWSPQG